MTLQVLLGKLIPAIERSRMPYMLTGSVASSAYGVPRSTLDLDVVIQPTRDQIVALIQQFPISEYYADEQQALQALASRSQFNVIDHATGWKVDFIVAEDSEYGRTALARRKAIEIAGKVVQVTAPEDVIIAKLRWAQRGGSERQLDDVFGIINTLAGELDIGYVERWVSDLRLADLWGAVRRRSS